MKILILGATGILGQHLFVGLKNTNNEVFGTIRNINDKKFFSPTRQNDFLYVSDIFDYTKLEKIFEELRIDTVINCISISNINQQSKDTLYSVFTNFPLKLGMICSRKKIRLILISSDGVFSGLKGNYSENDIPDPNDDYGKTKLMGELTGTHQLTLRLSLIGHDNINNKGLLEWLFRQNQCSFFSEYVFSGLTTNEITRIIRDYILIKPELYGLYNISGDSISKYDLLKLIIQKYNLKTRFAKDKSIKINRALLGTKFYQDTGYKPPIWPKLIDNMKSGKY